VASDIQIANLALDCIGARATISSFTEASAEARLLSRQYEQARDDVLAAAHWNFARRQLALTLLKDGTLSPPDDVPAPWTYEYAYPTDCIGARYIMPAFTNAAATSIFGPDFSSSSSVEPQSPAVPFMVSTDLDTDGNPTKVILTNQPQAVLVYTMRVTNPLLFDSSFVRALANYLGAMICLPLSGDKALARMAFQVADNTSKEARRTNGNEGPTVNDVMPDWLRARGIESPSGGSYYIQSPTDLMFIS
jgi:hypothetical protein